MNNFVIKLPETFSVALAVLCNHYGVGEERVRRLKEDGYNPDNVQDIVNDLVKIMEKAEKYDGGD